MLLFFAAPNMSLRAQVTDGEPDATKTVESITFVQLNGTTITYASGTFDNVTVLPGVGLKIYTTGSTTSVDYLFCQMSSITYTYNGGVSPVDNNVNANWNIAGMNIPQSGGDPTFTNQSTDNYAWRLEYPHINTSSTSQRVVKACGQYGITYSLEWDNGKVANRWTVYTMCAKNNATNTEDVIVRFEDFLRYFSFRDLHFAIELKEQGTEQETLAMLSAFGMLGKTVVTSFRFCCIETVKRLCPSCKVGYLVPLADSNCLSELSRIGGEQVCPQAEHLTPDQVTDLHSRGYNVRAWGCSTIPLMRHALACGVDGMTVNFPDRLVKELGR